MSTPHAARPGEPESQDQAGAIRFAPPRAAGVDLLVIAGEHSGDEHAARVVREMRAKSPALRIAALGGPQLAAAGAQLLHDMTASSVVGMPYISPAYRACRQVCIPCCPRTMRCCPAHMR